MSYLSVGGNKKNMTDLLYQSLYAARIEEMARIQRDLDLIQASDKNKSNSLFNDNDADYIQDTSGPFIDNPDQPCEAVIPVENHDHVSDITAIISKNEISGYEFYENYQPLENVFEEDNPSIDSSKIETVINTKFSKCSDSVKQSVRTEINDLRNKIKIYEEEKQKMISQFEAEKQLEIQEIQYQLQVERNKINKLMEINEDTKPVAIEQIQTPQKSMNFLFKTFPRQRSMRPMSI